MTTQDDERYMRRALELAERGMGFVNPNPMVGAVVVKDGRVIGEGYHRRFGELHAERNALAACSENPAGATVYVTLEPCCHYGKTPPCTEALVEAGVARVVVASSDPNPLVAGKGLDALREAGIEVSEGVCAEQALALNRPFFHFISTGKPLVVMKYAMTLDGKIATRTGESRWITGEVARENVHRDRGRYAAIMVGSGTVAADDPMLTCRLAGSADAGCPDAGGACGEAHGCSQCGWHNPLRVVVDGSLRTSLSSRIVQTAHDVETLIATCVNDPARIAPYEEAGCKVLVLSAAASMHVGLARLVEELGRMKVDSVLLEAGGSLAWAALEARIVDRGQAYVAPKMFGGSTAPGPVGGAGIELPSQCIRLVDRQVREFGDDILIEGEVEYCSPE